MNATEKHDVDAMANALRILEALESGDPRLWFNIGRASMTLRLAIGSRADVPLKLSKSLEVSK